MGGTGRTVHKVLFRAEESYRQNFNCISSLKDCNGITLSTDKEILEVAKTFYSDLYKSKSTCSAETVHAFDSVVPEKVLTADSQQQCEGFNL